MAAPEKTSVWRFSDQPFDADANVRFVSRREPFRFVDEGDDSVIYIAQEGDLPERICAVAYEGVVERPWDVWRQVADFQPVPPVDPFTFYEGGETIFLPSPALLVGTILNETVRVGEL